MKFRTLATYYGKFKVVTSWAWGNCEELMKSLTGGSELTHLPTSSLPDSVLHKSSFRPNKNLAGVLKLLPKISAKIPVDDSGVGDAYYNPKSLVPSPPVVYLLQYEPS